MITIKKIIKQYKDHKFCTCIDKSYRGGFWDLAGNYARDLCHYERDFEIAQQAYYDGLKKSAMIKEHTDNYCNLKNNS